jgi:hypothetical protein
MDELYSDPQCRWAEPKQISHAAAARLSRTHSVVGKIGNGQSVEFDARGDDCDRSMTTTLSREKAIRQIRDLGFTYVGSEEWKKILNAAQTPTRRPTPVMEPVGLEFIPQAELTEDEYRSLFPPIP